VDDIARGTIAGLQPVGYEVINLGSDEPIVLMDAIRLVEELTGEEASLEFKPRHPADILATWADIGKAERVLGWGPQVSFKDGVARLVAWYGENRKWAKDVVTR
jgi:UDP-glucuronate 4-epimerase